MSGAGRLAAFGLVLVAALGAGYGAGALAGPLGTTTAGAAVQATPQEAVPHGDAEHPGAAHGGETHAGEASGGEADHHPGTEPRTEEPAGLSATQGGYSLQTRSATLAAGEAFSFVVTGPDGNAVTEYRVEHTKELHLVAVERDGAGYRHVHPSRDAAGRWRADVDLTPGAWRLFADAVPAAAADKVVLGVDVQVAGRQAATAPVEPGSTPVVDGYTVALDGAPVAGTPARLRFAVTRDGRPVATEPYLGALGHLVVVREDDLAYLHVHPDTGALAFTATFPAPGRYRLFLDIKVDGTVRTAPFAVEVTA